MASMSECKKNSIGREAPWIVVINETMARTFWPNQNPIGQIITLHTAPSEKRREIVGVVGDVRQLRLAKEPVPEIYAPYTQQPAQCPPGLDETRLHKSVILRTRVISKSLIESLHTTLTDIASDSPVFGITSVQQLVANTVLQSPEWETVLGVESLPSPLKTNPEFGGGGWTRTNDLGIMRPSL